MLLPQVKALVDSFIDLRNAIPDDADNARLSRMLALHQGMDPAPPLPKTVNNYTLLQSLFDSYKKELI